MVFCLVALAVALAAAPFAGRLGRWGGAYLAVAPACGFAWLLGRILTASPRVESMVQVPWVPTLDVNFALRLDGLSAFFALLILGIGAFVLAYAGSYLHGHRDLSRFNVVLLAFMASMLGLVFADDALLLFIFWEGTSLTSYLLIGFDHEEESARVAARKALIVTGSGGLALLGGLLMLHTITDTWSISEWTSMRETILAHPLSGWVFALVLLGAFTKSAQVPFHFWLPAAMAGPTPVSAYLHSATMVKAGVFLLARLSPIWSGTPAWIYLLTGFGAATMLFSAWSALRFRDLKTILAYTTTMALGLLVMLLGLGDEASVQAAMGYLLVHALYKGSLFMMAGTVDHGAHTRDVDRLSGLRKTMPLTAVAAFLACASMAGLPPFLGFVGKEASYEASLHLGGLGMAVVVASLLANAALFAVAGVLSLKPFLSAPSEAAEHAHEGDAALLAGPLVLASLGLVFGLAPGLLDELLGAASSSVLGESSHLHLHLWHGFNAAFLLSLLTFALGCAIYWGSDTIRRARAFEVGVRGFADRPAQLFESGFVYLARFSTWVISRIYVGRLYRYMMMNLLFVLFASAIVIAARGGIRFPALGEIRPHEFALVVILVLSSGIGAFVEPAMRAIIAVGISGFCVALIYLLFGAPDVAMTQFAIETLTVILVVLTLIHLPRAALKRGPRRRVVRNIIVASSTGIVLGLLLLDVLAGTLPRDISDWYLHHSVEDAHGHNVVNVILVDFRGFDTWGEITVLTIAGLGVYALLRKRARWTIRTESDPVSVKSGEAS